MKASECKLESWEQINGFKNYEISSYGRVRSIQRIVNTWYGKRKVNSKILKTQINKGYEYVSIRDNANKLCSKKVHRLVADAFIPNPNNLPCINHKDENKLNNRVDNLEWCTVNYNINYGSRITRASNTRKYYSLKSKAPVIQYDLNYNKLNRFISIREAERETGLDSSCISKCCKKKIKSYKNFIFRYENESLC